jgi:hypothetical protein
MKVAMLVFSAPSDLSRGYRALMNARELKEAGHDVMVVFDGDGTETLAAFADPSHDVHGLLESMRDNVRGACSFCASSHGVKDKIVQANFKLLSGYKGHASLRQVLEEGYQIISY